MRARSHSARREAASAVSAARMGMGGGGLGLAAQLRVWANLEVSRPAIAMELKLVRNFRASLRTCLPVKPEAPRITMSNFEVGADTAMSFSSHFSLLHMNT